MSNPEDLNTHHGTDKEKVPAENNQEVSVSKVEETNEKMWKARAAWDKIRRSKTVEDITHEDIKIRDEWRAMRDEVVRLLQELPDDLSSSVEIAPSEKSLAESVEGFDFAGEALIHPATEETTSVSESEKISSDKEQDEEKTTKAKKDLKLGPMAGRDYTNMTMEEIDSMIFNARATGKRAPGIADEGLALWEEQKKLKQQKEKEEEKAAKERAEAEAKERQAKELKDRIGNLITQLSQKLQYLNEEVYPNLEIAKNTARMMETSRLEEEKSKTEEEVKALRREIKGLEKDLNKLEKGVGKLFKERMNVAFEKANKSNETVEKQEKEVAGEESQAKEPAPAVSAENNSVPGVIEHAQEKSKKKFSMWKWTKERAKTFFKDGGFFGEFIQAETLRRGTGFAAENAEAMSKLIKTEWDIDSPDAIQDIVNEALRVEKKTGVKMTDESLRETINTVSKDRKEANDDEKNYIIKNAIENLKTNLIKARGQATSETVLTEENLKQVEAEMKKELDKLSDAALVKDVKDFAKVMRDNLDKYWWLRYLYGGAEVALVVGGTVYMSLPDPEQVTTVAGTKGGAAATEGARQISEVVIKDNVWKTIKTYAESKGADLPQIAHSLGFQDTPGGSSAVDQLLQNWSQQTLDLNNSYESEWTKKIADGLMSSRKMPVGMMLKIPGAIMAIVG